jgi:hypothetical protein
MSCEGLSSSFDVFVVHSRDTITTATYHVRWDSQDTFNTLKQRN